MTGKKLSFIMTFDVTCDFVSRSSELSLPAMIHSFIYSFISLDGTERATAKSKRRKKKVSRVVQRDRDRDSTTSTPIPVKCLQTDRPTNPNPPTPATLQYPNILRSPRPRNLTFHSSPPSPSPSPPHSPTHSPLTTHPTTTHSIPNPTVEIPSREESQERENRVEGLRVPPVGRSVPCGGAERIRLEQSRVD
jgi:hypothetical protein